jgi:hypothetical protein
MEMRVVRRQSCIRKAVLGAFFELHETEPIDVYTLDKILDD